MQIKFTRHALERIKKRKIAIKEIKACIKQPNNIVKDKYSNFIAQKKVNNYLLRVFFRRENAKIIVITAYKTSKLSKYLIKS